MLIFSGERKKFLTVHIIRNVILALEIKILYCLKTSCRIKIMRLI